MTQKKHLKQIEVRKNLARFNTLLAGRRGGKTQFIVEDILENVPIMPAKSDIFYIGPTNQHAVELVWDKLAERMTEMRWRVWPKISKQAFEFSEGRKLFIIGAEKISRIRGHKVFRLYMDEIAYFNTSLETVWKAARPALADLKGGCIAATTPNGKGTNAYDFYLWTKQQKEWRAHHWHTLDNPFIDQDEIEAAKESMDEKAFNQEYMATWESYEGLCYYNFDENLHISKCSKILHDVQSIDICMDFNVNPTTLLVAQKTPATTLQFKKEYSLKNSSTLKTAENFCLDFKDYRTSHIIDIYGDASGDNRDSGTGFSDYYYLEKTLEKNGFRFRRRTPKANPSQIDRVAHVNSYLKNVYGDTKIEIDPSCKELIRDLSSQELEGRIPSDKNNLGHKADAFGYRIYFDHLMGARKPTTTIQL